MDRTPKFERRYGSGGLSWEEGRGAWRARSVTGKVRRFTPTSGSVKEIRAAEDRGHAWLDAGIERDRHGEVGSPSELNGRQVERAGLTLSAWTEQWLIMYGEKVDAGQKARRTIVSYRTDMTRYVLPTLGQIRLGELTGEHIERWLTRLAASPSRKGGRLKDPTVVRAWRSLHKVLSDARLGHNPCDQVEPPRIRDHDEGKIATWEPAQTNMFLAHTASCERSGGTRLHPLWVVAARTGLRRGELCGLRWRDVDLDTGLLTVKVAVGTDNHQLYPVPRPKGRKHRTVDMDPVVVDVLARWKTTQDLERSFAAKTWKPDPRFGVLVFTGPLGEPVHPNNLSRYFPEHIEHMDGDLPHTTLHRLRHAYGSALLAAGVGLGDVARRLGHSQQVLESTYARELAVLHDESRAQVLDAHERLWGG